MESKPYQGGLFSRPLTNAVEDPYIDKLKVAGRPHGSSKGLAQFGVSKGIPGKYNRLFEGENYISASKISAMDRMEGRKKFITPNGFRHSSPIKKSASKGDFFGTFRQKPPAYVSDGTYGKRGNRDPLKETGPKNFYTNPPRKSTGPAQGNTPKVCFEEIHYVTSNYDAFQVSERRAKTAEREKCGDRPAFKVRGEDVLDKPLLPPPGGVTGSAPTHATRKVKEEGIEDPKAFRPSSPTKAGGPIYGTFSKYPTHEVDPFDEKKILQASTSGRLLPMATQFEGLDEKIRERRPWAPSSPPKQMFTKSTMFKNE